MLRRTFISGPTPGAGAQRLAVKDNIDVRGFRTTAGSLVLRDAEPASADADCVTPFREAGWVIVGKATLHEFAFGATGINLAFGTPENPQDAELIPGGSSSGSAVAVASGAADCAIGTDTAGSVRMPAACCGVVGLKLTNERVSMTGVVPLAPSLDSLGLLGRRVDDVIAGARALGIEPPGPADGDVGWGRVVPEVEAYRDPLSLAAVTSVADNVTMVDLCDWDEGHRAARVMIAVEAEQSISRIVNGSGGRIDLVGADVLARLDAGRGIRPEDVGTAMRVRQDIARHFECVFQDIDVLCLPTLPAAIPRLDDRLDYDLAYLTATINLIGYPALAVPVPRPNAVAGSVQLVARPGDESLLLALGREIERAAVAQAT